MNGKYSSGKVDILSISIVGFITCSLVAIVSVVINPNITQVFSPKAIMYEEGTFTKGTTPTNDTPINTGGNAETTGAVKNKTTSSATAKKKAAAAATAKAKADAAAKAAADAAARLAAMSAGQKTAADAAAKGGYTKSQVINTKATAANQAGYDCTKGTGCPAGVEVTGYYKYNGVFYPIGGTGNDPLNYRNSSLAASNGEPLAAVPVSKLNPTSNTGGFSLEEVINTNNQVAGTVGYAACYAAGNCSVGAVVNGYYESNGRYYAVGNTGNNPDIYSSTSLEEVQRLAQEKIQNERLAQIQADQRISQQRLAEAQAEAKLEAAKARADAAAQAAKNAQNASLLTGAEKSGVAYNNVLSGPKTGLYADYADTQFKTVDELMGRNNSITPTDQSPNLQNAYESINTITFGTFGNYVGAYQNIAAQYPQASNLKQSFSQEGLIASKNLAVTLVTEGAVIAALPAIAAAGAAGGSILAAAGAVGGSAFTTLGAISTMSQTMNAAEAQYVDFGSTEAWKQTGLAALSLANLRSADLLVKTFSNTASTAQAINTARNINTVVSGVNLAVDAPEAYSVCSTEGASSGCFQSGLAVALDVGFGALDYKQGQLSLGNPFKKAVDAAPQTRFTPVIDEAVKQVTTANLKNLDTSNLSAESQDLVAQLIKPSTHAEVPAVKPVAPETKPVAPIAELPKTPTLAQRATDSLGKNVIQPVKNIFSTKPAVIPEGITPAPPNKFLGIFNQTTKTATTDIGNVPVAGEIDISLLHPHEPGYIPQTVDDLTNLINQGAVLDPIKITEYNGKIYTFDGANRVTATLKSGQTTINYKFTPFSKLEGTQQSMIEGASKGKIFDYNIPSSYNAVSFGESPFKYLNIESKIRPITPTNVTEAKTFLGFEWKGLTNSEGKIQSPFGKPTTTIPNDVTPTLSLPANTSLSSVDDAYVAQSPLVVLEENVQKIIQPKDPINQINQLYDLSVGVLDEFSGIGTTAEQLVARENYNKSWSQIWLYSPKGVREKTPISVVLRNGESATAVYKLHVTTIPESFNNVLEKTTAYLRELNILHKVAPGIKVVTPAMGSQYGKAITIYAEDPETLGLIVKKMQELASEGLQGIPIETFEKYGANLAYELPVPGTNDLLYYTVEQINGEYLKDYPIRAKYMKDLFGQGPIDHLWQSVDTPIENAAGIITKPQTFSTSVVVEPEPNLIQNVVNFLDDNIVKPLLKNNLVDIPVKIAVAPITESVVQSATIPPINNSTTFLNNTKTFLNTTAGKATVIVIGVAGQGAVGTYFINNTVTTTTNFVNSIQTWWHSLPFNKTTPKTTETSVNPGQRSLTPSVGELKTESQDMSTQPKTEQSAENTAPQTQTYLDTTQGTITQQSKPTIIIPVKFGDSKIDLPFSDTESINPYLKIPDFVKNDILSKLDLNCTTVADCQDKLNKLALADQTVYQLELRKDFIPGDLVNITKMGIPAITDGRRDVYLTRDAATKLQAFINEAKQLGYSNLTIRYGYRSYENQSDLYQNGERAAYVAVPGYSMHQAGIAFDLYKSKNGELVSAVNPALVKLGYKYGIIHPLDADAPHWVVADAAIPGFVEAVTNSGINIDSLTITDKQELFLQTMLAASQKYEGQIMQMSNTNMAVNNNANISQLPNSTQVTTNSSVSGGSYNKELVYYSQKDPRWADVPLTKPYDENGNRSKFAEYGCGETTTAMFLATYVDPKITPEYVLQKLYPPVSGGTGISLSIEVLNSYGFKTEPVYGEDAQFKKYIKSGKYVALGIRFSNGVTHHTIAVGVDENDNIILQDPYMGNLVRLADISATITGGYLVEPPSKIIN